MSYNGEQLGPLLEGGSIRGHPKLGGRRWGGVLLAFLQPKSACEWLQTERNVIVGLLDPNTHAPLRNVCATSAQVEMDMRMLTASSSFRDVASGPELHRPCCLRPLASAGGFMHRSQIADWHSH